MAGKRGAVRENVGRRAAQAQEREEGGEGEEQNLEQTDEETRQAAEREQQVLEGGPGQGADSGFEVTYRGRTFTSQEELDNYLDEQVVPRRAAQERTTPTPSPSPAPAPAPAPAPSQTPAARKRAGDEIDWDKELFTEPKKVFAQFRDELKAEVREEMVTEYRQEQAMRQFWTDFYTENKDMVGKERLVGPVFQENFARLGEMKVPDARKELANIVREELVAMGVQSKPQNGNPAQRNRTLVEGASGPATRRGGESRQGVGGQPAQTQPRSLSAMIRQRQMTRRGQNQAS